MIIAVDFDGTIVSHAYPKIGRPNKELILALTRVKNCGHKIILWTCRDGKELQDAVSYCWDYGLTFDAVNTNVPNLNLTGKSPKIYADWYIDDRNEFPFSGINFDPIIQGLYKIIDLTNKSFISPKWQIP